MPAGEDGSDDSDEDDSDEDSDESSEDEEEEDEEEEDEKEDEPLSLQWPDTRRKQATYLFLLPIIFPLWLTVPDVRNQVNTQTLNWGILNVSTLSYLYIPLFIQQKSRKFFVITFLGSILWIAVFSYLMVWWAHQVSYTTKIKRCNLKCAS